MEDCIYQASCVFVIALPSILANLRRTIATFADYAADSHVHQSTVRRTNIVDKFYSFKIRSENPRLRPATILPVLLQAF